LDIEATELALKAAIKSNVQREFETGLRVLIGLGRITIDVHADARFVTHIHVHARSRLSIGVSFNDCVPFLHNRGIVVIGRYHRPRLATERAYC
jgi:hypothetical protein